MDPLLNRERHECQRCGAHTYHHTCPTCGSMHLAKLEPMPDVRSGPRLQRAGARWERGVLGGSPYLR